MRFNWFILGLKKALTISMCQDWHIANTSVTALANESLGPRGLCICRELSTKSFAYFYAASPAECSLNPIAIVVVVALGAVSQKLSVGHFPSLVAVVVGRPRGERRIGCCCHLNSGFWQSKAGGVGHGMHLLALEAPLELPLPPMRPLTCSPLRSRVARLPLRTLAHCSFFDSDFQETSHSCGVCCVELRRRRRCCCHCLRCCCCCCFCCYCCFCCCCCW